MKEEEGGGGGIGTVGSRGLAGNMHAAGTPCLDSARAIKCHGKLSCECQMLPSFDSAALRRRRLDTMDDRPSGAITAAECKIPWVW